MTGPSHICIVLLTGLGDVVHGLPVVNALKRVWPDTRISWVVEPMPSEILRPHRAIDNVIVFHKKKGLAGVRDLRAHMRPHRFDLTLNFNIYSKSVWPTLLSRAPVRWTFGSDRAREGVWLAGNRRLPPQPRRHTQDMFFEFLDALRIEHDVVEWNFEMTPEERAQQREFVASLEGRRAVAIVPASANAKKDWPADRYVAVVDSIERDFGARAVLVGGPGEREVAAARHIAQHAAKSPLWQMGDGVRRLIWLLDACSAVVAPDTGPVHIARALETPVVGLYGHTNPWRVGPYRAYEDLWVDAYTDGTPDPSNAEPKLDRMERITSQMVIEKLDRALHG